MNTLSIGNGYKDLHDLIVNMGICGYFLNDINDDDFDNVLNDCGVTVFAKKLVLKHHFKQSKEGNYNTGKSNKNSSTTVKRKRESSNISSISEFDTPFLTYGLEGSHYTYTVILYIIILHAHTHAHTHININKATISTAAT